MKMQTQCSGWRFFRKEQERKFFILIYGGMAERSKAHALKIEKQPNLPHFFIGGTVIEFEVFKWNLMGWP